MSNLPPNQSGDQEGSAGQGPFGGVPSAPPPPPQAPYAPPTGQSPYGQPAYGQPAYGQPAYGQAGGPGGPSLPPFSQYGGPGANAMGPPPGTLAEWPQRALGWLIDLIPFFGVWVVFYALSFASSSYLFVLGDLLALAIGIFFAYQVGAFGSTPGMRMMGLKCVSLRTGQPIGAGMGIVRAILHGVAEVICVIPFIIDMLFPLWDGQKQTLADKIVGTVVITVPKQPFSVMPVNP